MISVKDAKDIILQHVKSGKVESRTLLDAIGFSLAEDIFADRDYPPFNRATMDGYALSSADLNSKQITQFKVVGELFAGDVYQGNIPSGTCIKIMTGAPLPNDVDCVIPVEDSQQNGSVVQFAKSQVKPYLNVAKKGEDCCQGTLVIPQGYTLDYSSVTTLATLGKSTVQVHSAPSVAIISTGDEIVPIDATPLDHQIRDSNSYVLKALLKGLNIDVKSYELVKDDPDDLKQAITKGLNHDILILSGGVSMGDADFVPGILIELGVKKVFHKVNIKPGKPLWFGDHKKGVVFGLPGNPVSCQVGFKVFIEPYIRQFMKLMAMKSFYLPTAYELSNNKGKDLYFPCQINDSQELLPVVNNGSGDISATLNSNGIAVHPMSSPVINKLSLVEFYFWRESQ